jgi:dihydroorotase
VIGLETAAAAINTAVGLDAIRFFDRMSIAPATIGRLSRQGRVIEEGSPANLVIFDPDSEWTVETHLSKSANSPFSGRTLRGRVIATLFEGRITFQRTLSLA